MTKKQDRRYRGARRLAAFVLMLAVSIGVVFTAAVWYRAARADYLTATEGVTVPLSVARVIPVTAEEAAAYHIESAVQAEDDAGRVTGYLIITTARGYKSDIRVQTTFAADGKTVAGIRVLSQDETEYLGTRVESTEFTSLFTGRRAPMKLWGTAVFGSPIDALSGSTVSSQAVLDAVNNAYAFLQHRL
jgi:RnfABCDGE-type electron transport complex G subunit